MYHYVRDIENSRYPQINGLESYLFNEQILYLKQKYNIITMESFLDSINLNSTLPENAALLTFDDGYIDHFTQVFPILLNNNIQGSFFIPAMVVNENIVLDVNKIHYILASCNNIDLIIMDIKILISKFKFDYKLNTFNYYYEKLAISNRFDDERAIFVKRLLQVELDDKARKVFIQILFNKYVNISESTLSKELYLNMNHIKCMKNAGMHIGAHGYEHKWLGKLNEKNQIIEILKSIDFLNAIGVEENKRTMCYPYGSFDDSLINILKQNNFQAAFTTKVDIAYISSDNKFTLPRLDTNEIPKDRNGTDNDWVSKA